MTMKTIGWLAALAMSMAACGGSATPGATSPVAPVNDEEPASDGDTDVGDDDGGDDDDVDSEDEGEEQDLLDDEDDDESEEDSEMDDPDDDFE